jgi:hypothetical protein
LISFIGTLHFRHVTYTPASHRSPLLCAVRQDLSKPRCFRSRIRIIQKPDCRTPDARRVSWLNRTDLFWASRTARARVPEGLPGRGGLPEYACFTLSEPNMVGPSPLCPTPRHIVASTFRRGVALAIGMRILDNNESSVLLGHKRGRPISRLGSRCTERVVNTTIVCPCDERPGCARAKQSWAGIGRPTLGCWRSHVS